MENELKKIKKYYGEDMAHFCRDTFPTILEHEGTLVNILLSIFNKNHYLYRDLLENNCLLAFKNMIYNKYNIANNIKEDVFLTPYELMDKAGYTLYKCNSDSDIQAFKKYYAKGEELCTFSSDRLLIAHVYFAVKKNVDEIRREDYLEPKREDLYGTSVISIQFSRDNTHSLSIKNRYNHSVQNPDATYSNDLDNIIKGLTTSFAKYEGMKQEIYTGELDLKKYVLVDNRYYKYNYLDDSALNVTYYCPDNIIIDEDVVTTYPKEKYLIMDYFTLDLVNKEFDVIDLEDGFVSMIGDISKIEVIKNGEFKNVTIINTEDEVTEIALDELNRIIKVKNNSVRYIGDDFLHLNDTIKRVELSNVKSIGDNFLVSAISLESAILPNVTIVGDDFIYSSMLVEANFTLLEETGSGFLEYAQRLIEVNMPSLRYVGNDCMCELYSLTNINLPMLESAGYGFLEMAPFLINVDMPSLIEVGGRFLSMSNRIKKHNVPCLNKKIGTNLY